MGVVGNGDVEVDDNGAAQVHVAVAVNVVDHDDDHVKVDVGRQSPS